MAVDVAELIRELERRNEYVETRFQTLAQIHANNASSYKMLILGVLLGLLAGLLTTLLYELLIATLPFWGKGIIAVITEILFAVFIFIFARDMKKSRDSVLKVKAERDQTNKLFDVFKQIARNLESRSNRAQKP